MRGINKPVNNRTCSGIKADPKSGSFLFTLVSVEEIKRIIKLKKSKNSAEVDY